PKVLDAAQVSYALLADRLRHRIRAPCSGASTGSRALRDRYSTVVCEYLPRFARGHRGGSAQWPAAAGVFRSGWLPLLQAAHADQFLPAQHRGENAPTLCRARGKHVGRPRSHLARWSRHDREGARTRAQGAIHADAALFRRKRKGGGAAQWLLSAATLRTGARLCRGASGTTAGARRLSQAAGARPGELGIARRAILPRTAVRPAP